MLRRQLYGLLAVGLLTAGPVALAQQSAKAPSLPPIDPNQARLQQTISGLSGPGLAIAFGDEAGLLAAASENDTIECWHRDVLLGVRSGDGTANVLKGHRGAVLKLAWNGGPVLASAGVDRKILLWSMRDGKVLHTLTSDKGVRALAMTPDGILLASAGEDSAVQLWHVESAKPVAKLLAHSDWQLCLCFSPDGALLASAGYDGTVRLWDVAKTTKLRELPVLVKASPKDPGQPIITWSLAFSPDGKTLAAGGADGNIYQFGVGDGKTLKTLMGHGSAVTDLHYHPGGGLLVSASKDRTVRLWNAANGQALKTLDGHTAWVEGVLFYDHGTHLASVGADRTVRLWDLSVPPKK